MTDVYDESRCSGCVYNVGQQCGLESEGVGCCDPEAVERAQIKARVAELEQRNCDLQAAYQAETDRVEDVERQFTSVLDYLAEMMVDSGLNGDGHVFDNLSALDSHLGNQRRRVAELEAELAPYRKARAAVERMIGDGYDVVVDWSDTVGGWVAFTRWEDDGPDFEIVGVDEDEDLGRVIDKAIEDAQVRSADDHDEYLTGEEVE